jgi:hypothetical protein
MGIDPKLRWRLFSSNLMMPSLPPCDGPAPSNSPGIHAIGTAITAAGIPPGTGGNSKIVVLHNDTINTALDGFIVLLSPSAATRGEHDPSNKPSTTVRSSVSYQPLLDRLGKCTSPSHELDNSGMCATLSHKLGKLGDSTHLPALPSYSTGGIRVGGTRARF